MLVKMKLLKNNIKTLKESFDLGKKNINYIVVPILIDIIFLLLVGAAGSFVLEKAIPYLEEFAEINVNAPSLTSMTDAEFTAFLEQSAEKTYLSNQAFNVFLKFIGIIFLLWVIFQGLNWFLASKCVNNKTSYKRFMLNFSIISLISLVLSSLIAFLLVSLAVQNIMSQNYFANTFIVNVLTVIFTTIILFFLFVSYSISHKYKLKELLKKTFAIGLKEFKKIIIAYTTLIILFFIVNYLMQLAYLGGAAALLSVGMLILMPIIALSRIYLIKTLN